MFFYFLYNQHVAIIGDIKGVSDKASINEAQKKLYDILAEINKKYRKDISSKFIITLDNEFQGLLNNGTSIMRILIDIERLMYPTKVRFGIGIGEITPDIEKKMSLGAEGPGYYRARAALEHIVSNEKRKQTNPSDTRFEIDGDNQSSTVLINTILSLMTVIKESWTDRQREIIWDMLIYQDSQTDLAKRLNIKQPTVHKSLSKGNYYAYKDGLETINEALGEIL